MKTKVIKRHWSNGKLHSSYHKTEDNKRHGLYESYWLDGSIWYMRYLDMSNEVKLGNYYNKYTNIIQIRYYIWKHK